MKVYRSKFYSWWTASELDDKLDLGMKLSHYHQDLDFTTRVDVIRLLRERFTKEESLFYYKYSVH